MGHTDLDEERKGRMLTDNQREYLASDPPHGNDSAERTKRGRIRARIRGGLKDTYNFSNIPVDDRRQLFEFNPVDDPTLSNPTTLKANPIGEDSFQVVSWQRTGADRDEGDLSMPVVAFQLFKFLYLGFHDAGMPEYFEKMLVSAVSTAERERLEDEAGVINVDFSVEHIPGVDIDDVKRKFDAGEELSGDELKALDMAGILRDP